MDGGGEKGELCSARASSSKPSRLLICLKVNPRDRFLDYVIRTLPATADVREVLAVQLSTKSHYNPQVSFFIAATVDVHV